MREDTFDPAIEADTTIEVARGSALLFGAQVIGNAGFFVAVLVLARGLGPADRGTMAFAIVASMIVARLSRIGVNEATTVFAAQRPHLRAALLTNLLFNFAINSAIAGAATFGALYALGHQRPAGLTIVDTALIPAVVISVAFFEAGHQFLLGCGRFRSRAVALAVSPWIYAGLVISLWLTGRLTVPSAIVAWIAAHICWGAIVWVAAARGIGFGRPSRPLLRESVRFGIRAWIGTLSDFLNFRTDQLLMGFLTTQAALGVYVVSVNLSEVLLYLPDATAKALLPFVARGYGARVGDTLRAFRQLLVVTLVTLVIAAAVGPPLIPLVFGRAFSGSSQPFLLLLPGAIGFAALSVFSGVLVASSRPGMSSLPPLVSLAAGLVLDVILIPRFGASGAAAAASAAFIAGGTAAAVSYRRIVGFEWHELLPRRRDVPIVAIRRLASAAALRLFRTRRQ